MYTVLFKSLETLEIILTKSLMLTKAAFIWSKVGYTKKQNIEILLWFEIPYIWIYFTFIFIPVMTKLNFLQPLHQSSASYPSEFVVICWFAAQILLITMVLVTLKTGVMMLKTLSIAGINYILKYTTNENSYYIYIYIFFFTKFPILPFNCVYSNECSLVCVNHSVFLTCSQLIVYLPNIWEHNNF